MDATLHARADTVTVTVDGRALSFTPAGARALARNLDLYAEKAERVSAGAVDVGPREGTLPDLTVWAGTVVPERST